MSPRTKKILILASIVLLGSIAGFVFLLKKIHAEGALLGQYITALNERDAKEASFIRIRRQVEETATDRLAIKQTFFIDESDSIAFLNEIESFAESISLSLDTQGLNKITRPDTTGEFITVDFTYSGTKSEVITFTKLLENLPYHSWLESLEITGEGTIWEGSVTLIISIQTP